MDYSNPSDSDATIKNNSGTVLQNGDERMEGADENALVINIDGGTIYMNNGIVENYTGGEVTYNNGEVYNYGGKVTGSTIGDFTEHGKGTEYFSVSVSTTNGSTGFASGFTNYNDTNWLGRSYDYEKHDWKTSTSDVTISPNSGYEIATLTIPDEYKNYVKATKNDDGSWTLSVTSGYNIKLSPTATLKSKSGSSSVFVDVSLSSDSDSDDSGNTSGQKNSDFQVSPPGSLMNQLTVNSVDFTGNGLSAPLTDVFQKVDTITAINNFREMGIAIPSNENIKACGVVDFKNAFVNAATGSVDVPVEATVTAGNTYTVALSDGTTIEVLCTADGILNIPFAANAQYLTFVIYGIQSNAFTASLQ